MSKLRKQVEEAIKDSAASERVRRAWITRRGGVNPADVPDGAGHKEVHDHLTSLGFERHKSGEYRRKIANPGKPNYAGGIRKTETVQHIEHSGPGLGRTGWYHTAPSG